MTSSCSFSDLPECMAAYCYDEKKGMMMDGLEEGRKLTIQVRGLLARVAAGEISYEDAEISARDLTSRVMKSFANGLQFLGQNDAVVVTNSSPVSSNQRLDAPKMEDSGESSSRNNSPRTKGQNDRRGSYKRRKSSNSWRRETPNLIDDGHAWRKYGQKLIHEASYPRNYYRCTHKYEQKCEATKHVQRIQEKPPMYRTTYYGHHTCRNIPMAPELVLDCPSPTGNSSFFLSFNSPNNDPRFPETKQPLFPMTTNHIKQEFLGNEVSTTLDGDVMNMSGNRSGSASTSSLVLPGDDRDDLRSVFDPSSNLKPDDMMDMDSFDDDIFRHLYYDLISPL